MTVASLFKGSGKARLGGATVSFTPGARTNWHAHPLGHLPIVTQGRGWVQAEGGPAREIGHGATRNIGTTHVAVAEASDGRSAAWLEPVSDDKHGGRPMIIDGFSPFRHCDPRLGADDGPQATGRLDHHG